MNCQSLMLKKQMKLFQELEFRQMKTQFDKYFGTGKEYDEIDTNGNASEIQQKSFWRNPKPAKKTKKRRSI